MIKVPFDKVKGLLFGACTADALGVPVEFRSRESLNRNPVVDMRGYGTHHQPPGTWSDDSSLLFCLTESLCTEYNLKHIAGLFCNWYSNAYWTAHNEVFDIGNATKDAIDKLSRGINPVEAGGKDEKSNGNGSLMRIAPLAYYFINNEERKFEIIAEISSLTHAHERSIIACAILVEFLVNLLKGVSPLQSYKNLKPIILKQYQKNNSNELKHFYRILNNDISKLKENSILSSGYVVHTLEAAIWSFLTTSNYECAVLKAVNLGEDTDTTGAVTGALAGTYYGFSGIKPQWIELIAKKDEILALTERFYKIH